MQPNILFVNIPSRPLEDLIAALNNEKSMVPLDHETSMPMGILYLSAYIKKYSTVNHVGILDYVLHQTQIGKHNKLEEFVRKIALSDASFKPDVIAISLNFTTSHKFALICVKIFSELWPDSIIVVGGNHATNSYRELLSHPDVDYVICGEGEIPFTLLINNLADGSMHNIKGVFNRNKSDKSEGFENADLVQDLSIIPHPDWDLIDMNAYTGSRASRWEIGSSSISKVGCVVSSRGCPYKCTFCSSHTVHGRKLRYREVDDVVDEIKELYRRYGINIVIPWDDMWTADRGRTLELLKKLRALNIPDFQIQYQNGLSVNGLDTEVIDELIACGMMMTAIAIESGSEYTQRHLIKKNCDLKKAQELVSYMKSRGVFVRALFILGFPGETKELMNETISYAVALNADWSVFSIASPLIGSEMYDQFVQMGCIGHDPSFWGNSTYRRRSFDTVDITGEELNELAYRANLKCNFVNNPNLLAKKWEKALTLYRDITIKFPFHVVAWYCIMLCEQMMGKADLASTTRAHIDNLIATNTAAKELFNKYNDLMPLLAK